MRPHVILLAMLLSLCVPELLVSTAHAGGSAAQTQVVTVTVDGQVIALLDLPEQLAARNLRTADQVSSGGARLEAALAATAVQTPKGSVPLGTLDPRLPAKLAATLSKANTVLSGGTTMTPATLMEVFGLVVEDSRARGR